MYLKAAISYKTLLPVLLLLTAMGCGTFDSGNDHSENQPSSLAPENSFTVPGQLVASDLVYSIQLKRKGSDQSAPIIRLDSNQQLQLSFDLLEFDSRQLKISFTHHNPDWSQSGLAPDFYQDGFYSIFLETGEVSRAQRPSYRRYQYEFPNEDIEFLASGNYMIHIEDADTGNFLFSAPFFISENAGSITSQVETRTTPRVNGRISHFPRSVFEVPDFIEQAQFDLSFYYVQNQFWGRAREAVELDTSTEGEVLFEMRQENPFTGDYEFQFLSLTNLSQEDPRIYEYRPAEIPPRVVLFDDVQGFSASPDQVTRSRLGNPSQDLDSRYANVHFRFDPDDPLSENTNIYLVGDFNNWSIQSNYALEYHSETQRWRTNGFIKEGTYSYKYVLLEDNEIRDLALDDSFTRNEQEYHAFVYFRDPNRFYYRLVQTNQFFESY